MTKQEKRLLDIISSHLKSEGDELEEQGRDCGVPALAQQKFYAANRLREQAEAVAKSTMVDGIWFPYRPK